MNQLALRRALRRPIALLTCVAFVATLRPLRLARADGEPPAARTERAPAAEAVPEEPVAPAPAAVSTAAPTAAATSSPPQTPADRPADPRVRAEAANAMGPPAAATFSLSTAPVTLDSLAVGGGDATGVSSQAISVPQGTGKIQGMGESFSTQLSTGVATFTVPISLPKARGGAQASLTLSYDSGAGHGVAGVGWDIGVPSIARQTDRGLPLYDDQSTWQPQQDRFVFNGGQELVPICTVPAAACTAIAGEVMPVWANGWQYMRPRVEGSYLRFFWSPDHKTWRVQSKSGESMELGVPLDGSGDTTALETDPSNPAHIFRWNLVRQYDNEGAVPPAGAADPAPVNLVVYRYANVGGMDYLTDIYDTPPATNSSSASIAQYAHHTRLVYAARPDATFSYRRGWRVDQTQRLVGIDVASMVFLAPGARHQVRRYHLTYDANYHVSLSDRRAGRRALRIVRRGTERRRDRGTGGRPDVGVVADDDELFPLTPDRAGLSARRAAQRRRVHRDGGPGRLRGLR